MKENYKGKKTDCPKVKIRKDFIEVTKGTQYHGLLGFPCNFSLACLEKNSLYNFPIFSASETSKHLPVSSFTIINNADISSNLSKYHSTSPFQLTSIQETDASMDLQEAPKNSINLCSFYSNLSNSLIGKSNSPSISFASFREDFEISNSQKELIIATHEQFAKKSQNEKHFQSISPNESFSPLSRSRDESDCELTPPSIRNPSFISKSSISIQSEDVLTSLNLELSMYEWDKKRKNIQMLNTSNNVCLIGESEELDSRYLFQSREALDTARAINILQSVDCPPEEEGIVRMSVANRLFLNGNTASKYRLCEENACKLYQIPPKVLIESQTLYGMETERNYPYGISPLLRKLVVYEETRQVLSEDQHCQIIYSCPVGGYTSTPNLKYLNEPVQSFTEVLNNANPLLNMLSQPILKDFSNISIKYISCGHEHIVGLSLTGKIFTWGIGTSGCLGHNDLKNYTRPEIVNFVNDQEFKFIECGGYHTVALTENGDVWTWGRNDVFQCGVKSKKLYRDQIGLVALRPFRLKTLGKVQSVACGEAHSLFLNISGEVIGCGWGEEGQLTCSAKNDEFNILRFPEKIVKIKCGGVFSASISENGHVYVWGNGNCGELGLGMSIKTADFPTLIPALSNEIVLDICCGESHMLAMTKDKVYGWGKGLVHRFIDSEKYPSGSDVICYAPVQLKEVNCLQKVLIPKIESGSFHKLLEEKLKEIKKLI